MTDKTLSVTVTLPLVGGGTVTATATGDTGDKSDLITTVLDTCLATMVKSGEMIPRTIRHLPPQMHVIQMAESATPYQMACRNYDGNEGA